MNIEELKRLAEAATMGPWKVDKLLGARHDDWIVAYDAGDKGRGIAIVDSIYSLSDAKYIAAVHPAAILELIQQRDELLAALKDAGFTLDKLRTASNGEQRRYAVSFAGNTIHVAPILEAIKDAIAKAEG